MTTCLRLLTSDGNYIFGLSITNFSHCLCVSYFVLVFFLSSSSSSTDLFRFCRLINVFIKMTHHSTKSKHFIQIVVQSSKTKHRIKQRTNRGWTNAHVHGQSKKSCITSIRLCCLARCDPIYRSLARAHRFKFLVIACSFLICTNVLAAVVVLHSAFSSFFSLSS